MQHNDFKKKDKKADTEGGLQVVIKTVNQGRTTIKTETPCE